MHVMSHTATGPARIGGISPSLERVEDRLQLAFLFRHLIATFAAREHRFGPAQLDPQESLVCPSRVSGEILKDGV